MADSEFVGGDIIWNCVCSSCNCNLGNGGDKCATGLRCISHCGSSIITRAHASLLGSSLAPPRPGAQAPSPPSPTREGRMVATQPHLAYPSTDGTPHRCRRCAPPPILPCPNFLSNPCPNFLSSRPNPCRVEQGCPWKKNGPIRARNERQSNHILPCIGETTF